MVPDWIQWCSKGSSHPPVSAMDFFDDPSLFVGGLEGLDEDGFSSAPSLVDELNLSADFEPLQVEPLGPEKHQGIMAPVSTHQAMPTYSQQMGHYIGMKAHNPVGQAFSGHGGTSSGGGGMIAEQHGQYHNPTISQVPQSNGLFCNSSSPMWGNQDQNGNMYHTLSQQQQQLCHQQQQLHNRQLHVAQQQTQQQQHHLSHHQQQEQHHRIRQQQLQQQQSHHQQLLNQHQQINPQTMSLQQQQHHNFSFHQESHSQSQQAVHHSQQQGQHQLTVGGPRFHSSALPSKSYLDGQNASLSGTCLQQQQQQQQGSYQLTRRGQAFSGSQPEDPNLPFPMHSSSMVHSLPTCSVSSAAAYQPAQYPAYPGEPEIPSLSQQSLSSSSVSRPTSTTAPLTSTVPELSGTACQFPPTAVMSQQHNRIPVSQAEECPFLRCSGETQGNCKSSEMFGESMRCYNIASQLPSEQSQSCGAINTNGYQALGDSFLPSEAQDGDLEDLEPPDLLPDLLPQLEAALSQQDGSNCSWVSSSQERGHEQKPPPVVFKEEKVIPRSVTDISTCFNLHDS